MSRNGSRRRLEEVLYSESPAAPRMWTCADERATVRRAPSGVLSVSLLDEHGRRSTASLFDAPEVETMLVRAGRYPGQTTADAG